MELVSESYKITRSFPKFETHGLMSQMNRGGVSIPSSI
ncbi:four helix bundle protein [Psychroserpens burtonensis]|nr:four helix bundle protein [Psychroserpens burtonensis]